MNLPGPSLDGAADVPNATVGNLPCLNCLDLFGARDITDAPAVTVKTHSHISPLPPIARDIEGKREMRPSLSFC